jgi:hypothetical protein
MRKWYKHTINKKPAIRYNDEWLKTAARIRSDEHGLGYVYQTKQMEEPWLSWDNGHTPERNHKRWKWATIGDCDLRQIITDNSLRDVTNSYFADFVREGSLQDYQINTIKADGDKLFVDVTLYPNKSVDNVMIDTILLQ